MFEFKIQEVLKECGYNEALFDTYNPEQQSLILKQIKTLEVNIFQLNELVKTHEFESINHEIHFFKSVKPELIAHYLYLSLIYQLYKEFPVVSLNNAHVFKKYCKQVFKFFKKEQAFYKYLKNNETCHDTLYFRRLETTLNFFSPNHLYSDLRSTCSHGLLVAKIKANEKWMLFCTKRSIDIKKQNRDITKPNVLSPVVWQAHKVDAIELVYALYYAGAINVEKCTLQELALQFEKIFNIEICSQLYRDFIDIKRRKIDATRFLNKLANSLKYKIDEDYF